MVRGCVNVERIAAFSPPVAVEPCGLETVSLGAVCRRRGLLWFGFLHRAIGGS